MMKNLGIFPISFFLLILLSEFFMSSCATRSAPGGGPRDTVAPVLDTSFPPNFSINFTSNEIELLFNEYISLKNPTQQISFSPPLDEKPTIESRGKDIRISWTDTLLDSTTYTISFGNSITDFTEGNVNDEFKYVFSTGDFIDSLELSGSVVDSKTGAAIEEIMVALYDYSRLKRSDSIPYLNQPTYYAYTDETGRFSLSNLKYGKFHVVAFEDTRGNFKLSTGNEKMAFLQDTLTLSDTTKPIELVAFNPAPRPKSFAPRHVAKGKIQFPFNYSVPNLEVTEMDPSDTNLMEPFLRFNADRDTASYWFEEGERDSIRFLVQVADQKIDTAVVYLRDYKKSGLMISPLSKDVRFIDPITFKSELPLDSVHYDDILVLTPQDSTGAPVQEAENEDRLRFSVEPSKRPKEFSIYLKKGAVKSAYNLENDSLQYKFTNLTREDLGNLLFKVETDSVKDLVLLIFDPTKKEIHRENFRGDLEVKLQNRKPGIYNMDLIIDRDGNGKWTTGSYAERRQPEQILSYKDQAEIRANWDLELVWIPEELNQEAPSDSTKASRSDKN